MLAGMLVQMVKMLESLIKHGHKADSLSGTCLLVSSFLLVPKRQYINRVRIDVVTVQRNISGISKRDD